MSVGLINCVGSDKPVVIGDDVIVGACCFVKNGVRLGNNCQTGP